MVPGEQAVDRPALVSILLGLRDEILREPVSWSFFASEASRHQLTSNPFALLLASILEHGQTTARAAKVLLTLEKNLGELTVEKLDSLSREEIISAYSAYKPRYPKKMAQWFKKACHIIKRSYGGSVEGIWSDSPSAAVLQKRFEAFPGIGQKKASMLVNMITAFHLFGVRVERLDESEISVDRLVRRVMLRTGLADKDTPEELIQTAGELYPEEPGAIDSSMWVVGKKWCHLRHPACLSCRLGQICARRTQLSESDSF
ncbi:MAG: endonuclease III domain-containing protein [Nitrospinota bacterium]